MEHPCFESSDIEIARGGVSYTVDTLEALVRTSPANSFHVLIGIDNLLEFDTWRTPERILELATVVVMTRPGFERHSVPERLQRNVTFCEVPEIGISSSDVRRRVKEGKSIRYLVPKVVESYILDRKLYA
jgi:nicotinate-nucleotide adenylyltransferase